MARPGETICSNCYAAIPAASTSCSHCGNAISRQPPARTLFSGLRTNIKVIWAIGSIGIVILLFVTISVIQWIANGGLYKDNSEPQRPVEKTFTTAPLTGSNVPAGTNITLNGSDYDMSEVTVAVSEFHMDKYLEAIRVKDLLGAYELSENHLIFRVPNGTYGLLLEMKPPKAKIRIYGPPDSRKDWKYFGQVGWVLSEIVKAR